MAEIEPIITENDLPNDILQPLEQLSKKDGQNAFLAADTPDHFLTDIEALAIGDKP